MLFKMLDDLLANVDISSRHREQKLDMNAHAEEISIKNGLKIFIVRLVLCCPTRKGFSMLLMNVFGTTKQISMRPQRLSKVSVCDMM
ncbi:hypothetical protein DICVIV_07932 [Dictyocaulus viviparus]|uniref:Uncharacterized protein n=1 Tax=Dictyocaulus viviparus TaxID=29172 RepID=A0A0D8XQE1_DICVI|nr:hypothetical protein DICVIV_07932 [Dictyocaulus viviparus]